MNAHLGDAIANRFAISEVADNGGVKSLRDTRQRHAITHPLEPLIKLRGTKQSIHLTKCILLDTWMQADSPLASWALAYFFNLDIPKEQR